MFLAPLLGIWLSYWIMHVFWDIRKVLAGLVSFVGVLMIAQPSLLFSTSKNPAPLVSANCTDKIDIFRPLNNDTCLLLGAQPGFPEATFAQRIFAVLVALAGVVGAAVGYCSTLLDWQARSSPHSRQLLCSHQHINLRGFGFLRLGSRIQVACRWM